MIADLRFVCNAVETFDLFALKAWAQSQLESRSLPIANEVAVEVRHPDREMDGSCRWCGCREDELVRIDF